MAKAVHSMIRVLDEERSVAFYKAAFSLEVADRFLFDGFTLVYMRNAEADFELEFTINKDRSAPYELGDGYGHMAFVVEDLQAVHARFTDLGLSPTSVKELSHEGKALARFFFVRDPDGYRIEVIQRQGRYR